MSDIIRGMQHAVNTAQETLRDHQFQLMERYFDTQTGEPIMRHVTLPDGRKVYIPVITLLPSNMLVIDELEMDFSVKVASSTVKSFTENIANADDTSLKEDTNRSSFEVFFSGLNKKKTLFRNEKKTEDSADTDVINIKIRFKSTEETEAAARIREMLYTQIV